MAGTTSTKEFATTFARMRPQCAQKPCQKTPGHEGVHWPVGGQLPSEDSEVEDSQPQVEEDAEDDAGSGSDTTFAKPRKRKRQQATSSRPPKRLKAAVSSAVTAPVAAPKSKKIAQKKSRVEAAAELDERTATRSAGNNALSSKGSGILHQLPFLGESSSACAPRSGSARSVGTRPGSGPGSAGIRPVAGMFGSPQIISRVNPAGTPAPVSALHCLCIALYSSVPWIIFLGSPSS
jgi:hypothetical protein